ncbi:hypothetical protein ANN_27703 [Periplaneta americana]|uniref:Myb-like domain-containing protein n=1 Tax=Periplaneta americana TaxID=6978 RepID=A0ABQ8RV09_PERAM|nr:hypothetical protein ANN_27703 [Periplaneta americana]
MDDLSEFLVLHEGTTSEDNVEVMSWDINSTKMLIYLYKRYRKEVGTMKLRTIKQMWKCIAKELSEVLKKKITDNHCESRWRVLVINYKKYVDGKNSTGNGRKFFAYAEEMDELYGQKRNIRPEVLLSSETVVPLEEELAETPEVAAVENNTGRGHMTARKKRKSSVVEQIRIDRLEYQRKRLEQEERKIALLERKVQLLERQLLNDSMAQNDE